MTGRQKKDGGRAGAREVGLLAVEERWVGLALSVAAGAAWLVMLVKRAVAGEKAARNREQAHRRGR